MPIRRRTTIADLPRRGGRPTAQDAPLIGERILDAATALLSRDGYGATSLEGIAQEAGVSKRTLYARFSGKAELLKAVVGRLVAQWLPAFDKGLDHGTELRPALVEAAHVMLAAALEPESLTLHRLITSEIGRFPELGRVLHDAGAGVGRERLTAVLARAGIADPAWAAEQFMVLVLTAPQRRALGLGRPLDEAERRDWAERSVDLFLHGIQG